MRLLPIVFASSFALLLPGSALANPPTTATWGWVTARHPTTASYTPAASDQGNSAGKTNTVNRVGVGRYNVVFPDLGLAANGGTAIVTALGSQPHLCTSGDIGRNSTTGVETLFVQCYSVSGVAADSQFSIIYTAGGSNSGSVAYLYANKPASADYTPDPNYQFNSTDMNNAVNTVHRTGAGSYQVTLPGMPAGESNLQVTTDGDGNCRLSNWSNGTTGIVATVNCRSVPPSTLTDDYFDILYTDNVGMTGVSRPNAAYLFANKPTTSLYTPAAAYRYSSGMSPYLKRTRVGAYIVQLPGMPKGGAAAVTAVGTGKSRCQLTSISTTTPQKVGVACFTPSGNPVDSKFTFSYTK